MTPPEAFALDVVIGLTRGLASVIRAVPGRDGMAPRVACVLDTTERAALRAIDELVAVRMGAHEPEDAGPVEFEPEDSDENGGRGAARSERYARARGSL